MNEYGNSTPDFLGINRKHQEKQSAQDKLNLITCNNEFESFIKGRMPDDATLDMLLNYPEVAKDWLRKAAARIRELNHAVQVPVIQNRKHSIDLSVSTAPVQSQENINAAQYLTVRLEADDLEILSSYLLSGYMEREIKVRYSQDTLESPNYWGLRIDETPLSKDEIERLFKWIDADDNAQGSTDFGEYPVVEICKGAAEALLNKMLSIDVGYSIGGTHGVWFFGARENTTISM